MCFISARSRTIYWVLNILKDQALDSWVMLLDSWRPKAASSIHLSLRFPFTGICSMWFPVSSTHKLLVSRSLRIPAPSNQQNRCEILEKIVFVYQTIKSLCSPMAVSFQCMTKSTTNWKKKKKRVVERRQDLTLLNKCWSCSLIVLGGRESKNILLLSNSVFWWGK